jgi:hypothetical protein
MYCVVNRQPAHTAANGKSQTAADHPHAKKLSKDRLA